MFWYRPTYKELAKPEGEMILGDFSNVAFTDELTTSTRQSRVVKYEISIPLVDVDYYDGKFENAKAGVDQYNSIGLLLTEGEQVSLLDDGIINFWIDGGYIETEEGYAFGVCWFVTALGGLVDEANVDWQSKYGQQLFILDEAHGHSKQYDSYFPNNGYGYAIADYGDGEYLDYSFHVNSSAGIKELWFEFEAVQDDPTAYEGMSINGELWVVLE